MFGSFQPTLLVAIRSSAADPMGRYHRKRHVLPTIKLPRAPLIGQLIELIRWILSSRETESAGEN